MEDITVGGLKGKFMTMTEYNELCDKIIANNMLIRELKADLEIGEEDG